MNTMFQNLQNGMNLINQIQRFAQNIKTSGQNPEAILNQLIQSGKVNQQQLNQARALAEMFAKKNNIK